MTNRMARWFGARTTVGDRLRGGAADRAYRGASGELDALLARAAGSAAPAPAGLHARIMREVRATRRDAAPAARALLPAWGTVAAVATACLLLAALWLRVERRAPPLPAARAMLAQALNVDTYVRAGAAGCAAAPEQVLAAENTALGRDLSAAATFLLACF